MRTHRNLGIARWSDIRHQPFIGKWRRFGKLFQAKDSTVAQSPYYVYSMYNMVGRSIASISDLGVIFTLICCLGSDILAIDRNIYISKCTQHYHEGKVQLEVSGLGNGSCSLFIVPNGTVSEYYLV